MSLGLELRPNVSHIAMMQRVLVLSSQLEEISTEWRWNADLQRTIEPVMNLSMFYTQYRHPAWPWEVCSSLTGGFVVLCLCQGTKKKTHNQTRIAFPSPLCLSFILHTCSFWDMFSAAAQIKLSRKKNKYRKQEGTEKIKFECSCASQKQELVSRIVHNLRKFTWKG